MRDAALGLAWLVSGTFLGGCDVVWAPYISTYEVPPGPAVTDLAGVDLAGVDLAAADLAGPADLTPAVSPLCDPNDASLVLCLSFEGQLADGSHNGLMVKPLAAPSVGFTKGMVGQAALFSASTTMYTVSDAAGFDVGAYTFEAWVRPDAQPASANMRMGLLDRQNVFGVFLYKDALAMAKNAVVLGCYVPGMGFAKALQIPLNTFSHIACTIGGTQATFYLNGSSVASQVIAAPPKVAQRELSNLGSDSPLGDDPLVGALDEVRLFSSVRTAAEIKAAYQR